MKAVIVSGGKSPTEKILREYIEKESYIICADSGANCLYEYNIIPNIILGDFDSIDTKVLKYFTESGCIIDKFPAEKDFTDTEAAVAVALTEKVNEIIFLGCTGSRIDHMLANIGLLHRCLIENIDAFIVDENNIISLHNKNFYVEGEFGDTFSLNCFGSVVSNLCIMGAKYQLNNYNLTFGDPRTVSNELIHDKVYISFDKGIVILIRAKD